jgi:hypothetical protein
MNSGKNQKKKLVGSFQKFAYPKFGTLNVK